MEFRCLVCVLRDFSAVGRGERVMLWDPFCLFFGSGGLLFRGDFVPVGVRACFAGDRVLVREDWLVCGGVRFFFVELVGEDEVWSCRQGAGPFVNVACHGW